MTDNALSNVELAYAQARKYGEDVARLYATEKARRNELETITQKLQAIFDTAPNGLVVVDNNLKIVEANPRFLALFQQTSDCIEQPLANLLPIEPLLAAMQSIMAGETDLSNIEVEIDVPVCRTLLINLSPLGNEQGWVLILHDLTERKRLEGLKDEFVNIAAHELRTPLAGVIGFVGVLEEELHQLDDPMMANLIQLILHSTDRLKTTIDELIDFATTQRNSPQDLHIADVDLKKLARQSVDLLQAKIESKNLNCRLEFPEKGPVVRGDRFILDDIIYQLVSNAVSFNKPGGNIIVRAFQFDEANAARAQVEPGTTIIEIKDSGIGIPTTDLEKIFDRFYQVEEHLTRGTGGLGLGLTIARRGVEQHGGQLTVASELGAGSVFRVTLPPVAHLNEVSIDNRLDIAHQQMLTYAKDMAQAIASERRMRKKLEQINILSASLIEKVDQLSVDSSISGRNGETESVLRQIQDMISELAGLSAQEFNQS
jgi:two-component system phosphate regulon sensor histidine kinase PhoR